MLLVYPCAVEIKCLYFCSSTQGSRKGKKGEDKGDVLIMDKSLGVTYCVPDIHWKFEIVGRAGIGISGLNSVSWGLLK